jgi:hypothetical protein
MSNKSASLQYERVNPKEIKITYHSEGKSTEVVARVVRPGTYNKCDISNASKTNTCNEGGKHKS